MRRKSIILLTLLSTLFLGGCATLRQIDEQMPVVLMGVDITQDDHIRICVKLPLFGGSADGGSGSSSGGGGGSGSGGGSGGGGSSSSSSSYATVEAVGKDWGAALTTLHATLPLEANFSQVREIVFGEELAQSDRFKKQYMNVCNLPSIRSQAYVVICKGEAKDFLNQQEALVGRRLSKYIDKTFNRYQHMAYVPSTMLGEGLSGLDGSGSDPLFIFGAITQEAKDEAKEVPNAVDVTAGNLSHEGLTKTELLGAAMSDGTRITGLLTGYETALCRLVMGTLDDGLALFADNNYFMVRSIKGASIRVQEKALSLTAYARFSYYEGQMFDPSVAAQKLKADIEQVVQKLQDYGCDAFGFCGQAKKQYLTFDAWKNANFKDIYRTNDIQVTLEVSFKMN